MQTGAELMEEYCFTIPSSSPPLHNREATTTFFEILAFGELASGKGDVAYCDLKYKRVAFQSRDNRFSYCCIPCPARAKWTYPFVAFEK
jgi:hypothetical protein